MKKLLFGIVICCLCLTSRTPAFARQDAVNLVINILLLQEESALRQSLFLSWQHPGQREDGSLLDVSELKNYQIRFRAIGDTAPYQLVLLDGAQRSTSISLRGNIGDQFEFAVRTIDKDGLASTYTPSAIVAFTAPESG